MMRSGIRIGRIFGINIRIDWSWLLIFFLITWNLATAFNDYHSSWSAGLDWGLAIVAALLFFGSVLAHELAHSLVARSQGVPVRSITLFLFGGVSDIQREPDSPRSEFLITIVGPLTSLIIGVILVLIVSASSASISSTVNESTATFKKLSPLSTILLWLGSINLLLGVFNLIPGFPLDGGRVLRSILWGITNDVRRATRWASWAGQAVAWIFIVIGISMVFGANIPFFGTGLIGGLWLAFIGWFLSSAASQSYQQLVIHDILENVPVSRMMLSNPPTVPSNVSISTLVHEHVMQSDDYAFPVVDADQFVGMVTLADVRTVSRNDWDTVTVREIMTPRDQLAVTAVDEDATEAWQKLLQRDVRQLPVLSNGHLVGLLRRRDIIRWLQLHAETSAHAGAV